MKRWICGLGLLFWMMTMPVHAMEDEVLSQLDFREIDKAMEELYPDAKLDFVDTVKGMISGDLEISADTVNRLVADQIGYAFRVNKEALVHMLVLAIFAAIFSNFTQIFKKKQIAEVGFYVVYLLMIAMAMKSFGAAITWTQEGIEGLVSFMKVFSPVYFFAVAIARGSLSSIAFYQIALFIILAIEIIIVEMMIPIIHVYIVMRFLDCLSEEEYLSKFAELLEAGITWSMKAFLALVVGLNVIQGLIAPAIDTVKRSVVTRSAEAIPGIGDALGGTAEVLLGTAVLVKNGIGMTGAVICLIVCIVPVMQLGFLTLLYKVSAALIQPVSDKRMVRCISSVGEGCRLLMKIIITVVVLFLLTIAIAAAMTGKM